MKRRVIGTMTGTSCDGLDLALVEVQRDGTTYGARCLRHAAFDWRDLGQRLRQFCNGQALSAAQVCQLRADFSAFHVQALEGFAQGAVDLIAIHGQTLHHAPPLSWQMVDLAWIASQTQCPVIGDLRSCDLSLGGQGAPITPLADQIFYGRSGERRAVVNLGGFCNITILPGSGDRNDIVGYDLCAANQLLDGLCFKLTGHSYDVDGALALSGSAQDHRVEHWLRWLQQQYGEGRSLGQNHVLRDADLRGCSSPADELASAVLALAQRLWQDLEGRQLDRVLTAGGGWKNFAFAQSFKSFCAHPVEDAGIYGPSGEAREAAAMALLGAMAWDGEDITLSQITHKRQPCRHGLRIDPR